MGAFNETIDPWVFVFFHGSDEYLDTNKKLMEWLKDLQNEKDLLEFRYIDGDGKYQINSLRTAYINLIDDGELLKETFDVKKSPRFVFIKDNIQYPYVTKNNNLSYGDLVDLVKFNYNKAKHPKIELRPLVDQNLLVFEYASTTVGDWFIENEGPKYVNMLKDEYNMDLSQFNENLGKKQWVKSQGRTLIYMIAALVAVLYILMLLFILTCCMCCCRSGKKAENQTEGIKVKIS